MSVGVIGGTAVPHAPQFFTLPPTEDAEQVARIESLMGQIGEGLRALEPDVVVVVANDHLDNFMLHCAPSFTMHCGADVRGGFAGRDFHWPVASDLAMGLVRHLQDEGFDPAFTMTATIGYEFGIPLTFCGFDPQTKLLPIYVNTYVAPQPRAERCFAFGQALDRGLRAQGVRAVMIASGGLSHFPGTKRYSEPDVETDRWLVDRVAAGNLKAVVTMDDQTMDRTGNVELRSWQILAGALGDGKPDHTLFDPSWHHNYAVFGWTSGRADRSAPLHYPQTLPGRVELSRALYTLRMESPARRAFMADPAAFASRFDLDEDERSALVRLEEEPLNALGIHPLLTFLARLQVDLEGKAVDAEPQPQP
ncbi:MAG: hypothetical protein ACE14W_10800 [Candidatus Velamenicoccus archaeovorus]